MAHNRDPILEYVNQALDRLRSLDEALANANVARFYLARLNEKFEGVTGPQKDALSMARSSFVSSTVSGLMACWDYQSKDGDRASAGQVIHMLSKSGVATKFAPTKGLVHVFEREIASISDTYFHIRKSKSFLATKRLRDRLVSHILVDMPAAEPAEYADLYFLFDEIEALVKRLFFITARGKPLFIQHREATLNNIELFWKTYALGQELVGRRG